MDRMPNVKLVSVTKKYRNIVAVNEMNLHVDDGEYVSILGPTGSGKTTTLRLVAGLVKPDVGKIYIDNKLVNNLPPEERDVAYVFQNFALFPHMRTLGNVTFGPLVRGLNVETAIQTAHEVLRMVHLDERSDAYPSELSGGMQQRVALARALASGARLLLLDEPLSALDARLRIELRYELRRMVKQLDLTAIHVTHDQEEAMTISDRIAILKEGRIEQIGAPQEMYAKPRTLFVANFMGEANFLEGIVRKVLEDYVEVEVRGGVTLRVRSPNHGVGDRVVVALRPENLLVRSEVEKAVNPLWGYVKRIDLSGSVVRYVIVLDNEDVVSARILAASAADFFKEGDRIIADFKPEQALVFPYPPEGLAKALKAE